MHRKDDKKDLLINKDLVNEPSSIPDFDQLTDLFAKYKSKHKTEKEDGEIQIDPHTEKENEGLDDSLMSFFKSEVENRVGINDNIEYTSLNQTYELSDESPVKFNRPITDFIGSSVVIGCGDDTRNSREKQHQLHANKSNFYSIDLLPVAEPDCECDIGRKYGHCPKELEGKFDFIYLENVTASAYLSGSDNFSNAPLAKMMQHNCVMLIAGIVPVSHSNVLEHQIADAPGNLSHLYIQSTSPISPVLIIKSLDQDAQALIKLYGIKVDMILDNDYDVAANETFLRQAALKILTKEIGRLTAEEPPKKSKLNCFAPDPLVEKELKLQGLKALFTSIEHTDESLVEEIKRIQTQYPALNHNFFKSHSQQVLDLITAMAVYHEKKVAEQTPRFMRSY